MTEVGLFRDLWILEHFDFQVVAWRVKPEKDREKWGENKCKRRIASDAKERQKLNAVNKDEARKAASAQKRSRKNSRQLGWIQHINSSANGGWY